MQMLDVQYRMHPTISAFPRSEGLHVHAGDFHVPTMFPVSPPRPIATAHDPHDVGPPAWHGMRPSAVLFLPVPCNPNPRCWAMLERNKHMELMLLGSAMSTRPRDRRTSSENSFLGSRDAPRQPRITLAGRCLRPFLLESLETLALAPTLPSWLSEGHECEVLRRQAQETSLALKKP